MLNLAPQACADVSAKYAGHGIEYLGLDAEDQPGYSLLELHMETASAFLEKVRAADGLALVHCFAGVNRSAALAIAFIVLTEREPLEAAVKRCFALRPWILTNATFREELCSFAEKRGLGQQPASSSGEAAATSDEAAAPAADEAAAPTTWYQLDEEPIGDGAFAVVYRCVVPSSKTAVAAKVVSKKARWVWIGGKSVRAARAYESLLNERAALTQLGKHPRCVGLEGWVEETDRALLLLELAPGGDLETLVASQPDGVGETAAHGFASDLFAALAHCHSRGVSHRDVKLANLLLAADGTLRLSDFGHSAVSDGWQADSEHPRLHDKMGTKVGSAYLCTCAALRGHAPTRITSLTSACRVLCLWQSYCAPEIIACQGDEGYLGPPSDLWSAGICWFALLCGRLPFAIADDIADWRFAKVAAAQEEGRSSCEEILSWTHQAVPWGEPVCQMVDALLSTDPARRPSAAQAVKTGWLNFHAVRRTASFHSLAQAADAHAPVGDSRCASAAAVRVTRSRSREASLDALGRPASEHSLRAQRKSRQPSEQGLRSRQRSEQSGLGRQRSGLGGRERSLDGLSLPADGPRPQNGQHLRATHSPFVCTYGLRSQSGVKRGHAEVANGWDQESHQERTCVWRGVETATATGMQSTAAKSAPHNGVRYSVMRSVEGMRHVSNRMVHFDWLREDRKALPLVDQAVDRPFKVERDNNNNYAWGVGAVSTTPDANGPSPVKPGDHPSRRMCPWGR